MKLEELVYRVEARLLEFGRSLLQVDEKSLLREELGFTQDEVATRLSELERAEAQREALRREIIMHQAAAGALPGQIRDSYCRGKMSQALRKALELESVRRELEAAKAQLRRLEQAIWSLCFHVRLKRRSIARMREQLSSRRS